MGLKPLVSEGLCMILIGYSNSRNSHTTRSTEYPVVCRRQRGRPVQLAIARSLNQYGVQYSVLRMLVLSRDNNLVITS